MREREKERERETAEREKQRQDQQRGRRLASDAEVADGSSGSHAATPVRRANEETDERGARARVARARRGGAMTAAATVSGTIGEGRRASVAPSERRTASSSRADSGDGAGRGMMTSQQCVCGYLIVVRVRDGRQVSRPEPESARLLSTVQQGECSIARCLSTSSAIFSAKVMVDSLAAATRLLKLANMELSVGPPRIGLDGSSVASSTTLLLNEAAFPRALTLVLSSSPSILFSISIPSSSPPEDSSNSSSLNPTSEPSDSRSPGPSYSPSSDPSDSPSPNIYFSPSPTPSFLPIEPSSESSSSPSSSSPFSLCQVPTGPPSNSPSPAPSSNSSLESSSESSSDSSTCPVVSFPSTTLPSSTCTRSPHLSWKMKISRVRRGSLSINYICNA
ncbi:hypothetical protein Scep_010011 [Stephania cephalantha]|uniref:Uncharacterized protein n=1 Tax=Stephania cephalantha TaxID=152367 RepID=A0AAP0JV95_9MAGN